MEIDDLHEYYKNKLSKEVAYDRGDINQNRGSNNQNRGNQNQNRGNQNRGNQNRGNQNRGNDNQRSKNAAPMSEPPSFAPATPTTVTGPRGIGKCINRNTYIWMNNGNQFWFYPTMVNKRTLIGFRWMGFNWIYNTMSLDDIRSFQCY